MKECDGCRSWIPDDAGTCPSCGRAAAPPVPPAPAAPGEAASPPQDPGSAELAAAIRARSAARVRTLGVLYIVHGALLVAMVAWSASQYAAGKTEEMFAELRRVWPADAPEFLDEAQAAAEHPAYLLASHFLPFALGGFLLWSGISLRGLHRRNAALVAAIALLALSPCQNCCCLAGIPLGIWALYVLTAGETRVVTTA